MEISTGLQDPWLIWVRMSLKINKKGKLFLLMRKLLMSFMKVLIQKITYNIIC